MRNLCALFLLLALAGTGRAQTDCDHIRALKRSVYTPENAGLTTPEAYQAADSFWHMVERAGKPGEQCLIQLISEEPDRAYFLSDAVELLVRIDSSKEAEEIALRAALRSNMPEGYPSSLLVMSLSASHLGIDVSRVLREYLLRGKEQFLTDQQLMITRPLGAMLLTGILGEDASTPVLEGLLSSADPQIHYSVIPCISMLLTDRGFQLMDSLRMVDTNFRHASGEQWVHMSLPPEPTSPLTRLQVLDTLNAIVSGTLAKNFQEDMNFVGNLARVLEEQDVPLLRAVRQRAIQHLSKSELNDYSFESMVLLSVIDRLGMYKKYRS